jgi:putative FmdB family regulatory protein
MTVPIYEYVCDNCGHNLEAIQKISDPPLTECPACHESELRKQVSAAAFHLKGDGWYATDYKDKPKQNKDDNLNDTKSASKNPDKTEINTTASEPTVKPSKSKTATSN